MTQSATYDVRLPSGKRFSLRGTFGLPIHPKVGPMPIIRDGDKIFSLDPRAIVEANGQRAYGPRDLPLDLFTASMIAWLTEHNTWDAPT